MHIFIDESGTFATPQRVQPSVCCVATLAVPDSSLERVQAFQQEVLADWKPTRSELKGSTLTERKIERVISRLSNMDVVLGIVAIDMGLHSEAAISAHKRRQEEMLRESVAGPEFARSFREAVYELGSRVARLPNQLYVQSSLLTEALARTLQTTIVHYSQTEPSTLESFSWRIDAKDKTIQKYERLWMDLIHPMSQTMSMERPIVTIHGPGFDYSAMAPFQNPERDEAPAHLVRGHPEIADGPFHSFDARKFLADLVFGDSHSDGGLQLAGVLSAGVREAAPDQPRG